MPNTRATSKNHLLPQRLLSLLLGFQQRAILLVSEAIVITVDMLVKLMSGSSYLPAGVLASQQKWSAPLLPWLSASLSLAVPGRLLFK